MILLKYIATNIVRVIITWKSWVFVSSCDIIGHILLLKHLVIIIAIEYTVLHSITDVICLKGASLKRDILGLSENTVALIHL